ncbi:MAG: monovalent cation/H+ antiporter complex subunit F [Spirochaetia bacterium]|jgi:multicomponent Na+:H+ antiporter subunit F|nr:monovalent cation/H+ antiporter complex subunit F [Spirochaetia bacterium]
MNTEIAFNIIIYLFIASGVISLYRVLAGPTAADRLIGLNIISAQILAVLVLFAAKENLHVYLDVALVYDIFGFVGILAIARYTGKKEALK